MGDLTSSELERCASHVAGCPPCSLVLEALDGHADEFVSGFRELRDEELGPEEAVPERLIRAARRAQGAGEWVADAGARIADALGEGKYHLGRFVLESKLGAGTFGHVFRARDTELDRTVAIKVQRAGVAGGDDDRNRFLREARSAAQLEHPGIVSLYETGQTPEGVPYLVSEFVAGQTLEERMASGVVDPRDAADWVAGMARALDYAHGCGVIHRDVKPSNVLMDDRGCPHVTDFGLAKRDFGEVTVTPQGAVLGTPAYMSPELARGESHTVDARSDVYSLGVVLYELLAGERPFHGNRRLLMLQVLEDEPRSPRRLRPSVPRDLETICLRAMQKSRSRRYASAGAMADDLGRYLSGEAIHARREGPFDHLRRWCGRNPSAASLFVAISLGSAIGFVHLSRLSSELIRSSAMDSAAQYAEMLEVVNDLYSSEVVARVGHHGVEATADYATRDGAIPLPATLLTELLERISDGKTGMRGRHYSDYPFLFRLDGGPADDFEREALARLELEPEQPYARFEEDYQGGPALRFATARIMQASCVECHNSHPASRKKDWAVGDVRGVLEIIRPLDRDRERTREGLRGTTLLVAGVSAVLLWLTATVIVLGSRRRRGAGG